MDRMPPSEGGDAGSIPAEGILRSKITECEQLLAHMQESKTLMMFSLWKTSKVYRPCNGRFPAAGYLHAGIEAVLPYFFATAAVVKKWGTGTAAVGRDFLPKGVRYFFAKNYFTCSITLGTSTKEMTQWDTMQGKWVVTN